MNEKKELNISVLCCHRFARSTTFGKSGSSVESDLLGYKASRLSPVRIDPDFIETGLTGLTNDAESVNGAANLAIGEVNPVREAVSFATDETTSGKKAISFVTDTAPSGKKAISFVTDTAPSGKKAISFATDTAPSGKKAISFVADTAPSGKKLYPSQRMLLLPKKSYILRNRW